MLSSESSLGLCVLGLIPKAFKISTFGSLIENFGRVFCLEVKEVLIKRFENSLRLSIDWQIIISVFNNNGSRSF